MSSLTWKRYIAKCYRTRHHSRRKIILIYHAVGNGPWAIPPVVFKQQIQWLKSHCKIVSLSQLLSNTENKDTIEVALTFDDGYSCLYDTVLPILQAENATATVYINTGWIGDSENSRKNSRADLGHYPNEKFLIWDEVKLLEKSGWEIGSHGVEHIDLTQQAIEVIKQELTNSKIDIENKLQKPCPHFAYTWGKNNFTLQNQVKEAGYQFAVAGQHGIVTPKDNLLALPRMNIALDYTMKDFENIITGRWDFLNHIHKLKKKLTEFRKIFRFEVRLKENFLKKPELTRQSMRVFEKNYPSISPKDGNFLKLAINAFNIRKGGGVTHLIEFLAAAEPLKQGFSEVSVWSNTDTLALLPERPWLKKISPPAFNKSLLHKMWWNFRYFPREMKNYDLLFMPGGTYFGKFKPFVNMFQNALPFDSKEKRRFFFASPLFFIKWNLLKITQGITFKNNCGAIFPSYYLESLVFKKIKNTRCQNSIVIPHGINPIFFNKPEIDSEKLIDKKLIRVVYSSRIDLYKHPWNVIKAVALLRHSGIPVRLDLCGYIGNPRAFKKMKAAMKLADPKGNFIEYHGHLKYEMLPSLYKQTDIFIFASTCESISSILLEAMASGLAIACSKIPVTEEVLKDAGVYFNAENPKEIKNAIYQLISDDNLRRTCKEKAYEYANQYSWAICADQTFSFLQNVSSLYHAENK